MSSLESDLETDPDLVWEEDGVSDSSAVVETERLRTNVPAVRVVVTDRVNDSVGV